ncbi:hypothetical protein A9G43_03620 [Gilliamella sp. Occ3-1]|nr:hypothetical protein A9G43_03620 [Gilliamella apicola]
MIEVGAISYLVDNQGYYFTKLVVAHRAENVNMADRAQLLDDGLIVADSLNTLLLNKIKSKT